MKWRYVFRIIHLHIFHHIYISFNGVELRHPGVLVFEISKDRNFQRHHCGTRPASQTSQRSGILLLLGLNLKAMHSTPTRVSKIFQKLHRFPHIRLSPVEGSIAQWLCLYTVWDATSDAAPHPDLLLGRARIKKLLCEGLLSNIRLPAWRLARPRLWRCLSKGYVNAISAPTLDWLHWL